MMLALAWSPPRPGTPDVTLRKDLVLKGETLRRNTGCWAAHLADLKGKNRAWT